MAKIFEVLKKSYPVQLIKGRLEEVAVQQDNIQKNNGTVVEEKGSKVAIYKDGEGNITKLDPICTHLGCVVSWNEEEKTWDCPCHRSRFKPTGEVISGPATRPLARK